MPAQQGVAGSVPRQDVRAAAEHQGGSVDRAQEIPCLVVEFLGPGTARPRGAAGGGGEPFEVFAFVAVEPERAGDGVEHLGRGAA